MCESHEPRRVGMLERDLIACIHTQDLEAGVAAWDRHGPPPSCRAVSSLRHLVWLTILGSSIPYQMLPCLPAGCGPEGPCTKVLACGDTDSVCTCVGRQQSLGWVLKLSRPIFLPLFTYSVLAEVRAQLCGVASLLLSFWVILFYCFF